MAKLQETEAGRFRVAKMSQRVDRYNAEQDAKRDLEVQGAASSSSGPQALVSVDLPTLKPMDVPESQPTPEALQIAAHEHEDEAIEVDQERAERIASDLGMDVDLVNCIGSIHPTEGKITRDSSWVEQLRADVEVRDIGRLYEVAELMDERELSALRFSLTLLEAMAGSTRGRNRRLHAESCPMCTQHHA